MIISLILPTAKPYPHVSSWGTSNRGCIMSKTLTRIATTILVLAVVVGASGAAIAAGPLVRITFSGTGTQTGVPGIQTFSGSVQYDSSRTITPPATHYFDFTGNGLDHEVCYETSGGVAGSGIPPVPCDPYYIHTSTNANKLFELHATAPNTVTVLFSIPAAAGTTFSPTALPKCPPGGADPFSTNSGSFILADATTGAVLFTGTINSASCSQPALGSHCSCNATPGAGFPTVAYAASAPMQSCQVYACPPRRSGCLTGLFARICQRNRCW
jgi:hypothetical protein